MVGWAGAHLGLVMEKDVCSKAVKELEAPSTGTAATARRGQGTSTGMAATFGKISVTPRNLSANPRSGKPFSINNTVLLHKAYPELFQGSSPSGRPREKKIAQRRYQGVPAYLLLQGQGVHLRSPSPASGRPTVFGE